MVLAMNDGVLEYEYPPQVRFELRQDDLQSYFRAADFLNLQNVDVVCVEHEFGIYGGKSGSYLLSLLRNLQVPIVTTLHTILSDPDAEQRKVMDELIQLSDRLIVMSHRGVEYLKKIYGVPHRKIDFIPHGIPDIPFVDPNFYKDKFGVEGKTVLLTFGLLSANKGLEYVIQAMPKILQEHPDTVYIILGKTHPHVIRYEGERYRESLEQLAKDLGIEEHVIFHNEFVTLPELVEHIGATDIYVTPYLNKSQVVSGTLAYTVGAGKAVISTPYWYAQELLADERGILIPMKDEEAIADQVLYLLNNEMERHAIRKRAYLFGRNMIWAEVVKQTMKSFNRARLGRMRYPHLMLPAYTELDQGWQAYKNEMPSINLDHLLRMTDHIGIFQHAVFDIPNYKEGYTTDDNARALILTLQLEKIGDEKSEKAPALASAYLGFLYHAFNEEKGRFRNFLSFDRKWLEEVGSDDSHGRAIWALGSVLGQSEREASRGLASRLFNQALPAAEEIKSLRACAFSLLGITRYLSRFSGDRAVQHVGKMLVNHLLASFQSCTDSNWHWCEDILTYDNASIPHALLLSSHWLERPDIAQVALESLRWLAEIQTSSEGYFVPIGSQGFYPRYGIKARFDQQPLEASSMVSACLDAYRFTGDQFWCQEANRAFQWFLGRNDINVPLYDRETGGCNDGLHPSRVNQNQGAESTVSFLLALSEMYLSQPYTLLVKQDAPSAD